MSFWSLSSDGFLQYGNNMSVTSSASLIWMCDSLVTIIPVQPSSFKTATLSIMCWKLLTQHCVTIMGYFCFPLTAGDQFKHRALPFAFLKWSKPGGFRATLIWFPFLIFNPVNHWQPLISTLWFPVRAFTLSLGRTLLDKVVIVLHLISLFLGLQYVLQQGPFLRFGSCSSHKAEPLIQTAVITLSRCGCVACRCEGVECVLTTDAQSVFFFLCLDKQNVKLYFIW